MKTATESSAFLRFSRRSSFSSFSRREQGGEQVDPSATLLCLCFSGKWVYALLRAEVFPPSFSAASPQK